MMNRLAFKLKSINLYDLYHTYKVYKNNDYIDSTLLEFYYRYILEEDKQIRESMKRR